MSGPRDTMVTGAKSRVLQTWGTAVPRSTVHAKCEEKRASLRGRGRYESERLKEIIGQNEQRGRSSGGEAFYAVARLTICIANDE